MAKAIWSGVVSFGLVNLNVSLVTAVSSHDQRFNQLNAATTNRIRQIRHDAQTNDVVPFEQIVKGAEVGPEAYVVITDEDLATLAPKSSKVIDIECFIDWAQVHPLWLDRHWYIQPEDRSRTAYHLLAQGLQKTQKIGVGSFVMRSRNYPVLIHPIDHTLVLTAMHWADEVIDPATIVGPADAPLEERFLTQATGLIEALSDPDWHPTSLVDTYTTKVKELIAAKAEGQAITAPAPHPERVEVVDLMEALAASVATARERRATKNG